MQIQFAKITISVETRLNRRLAARGLERAQSTTARLIARGVLKKPSSAAPGSHNHQCIPPGRKPTPWSNLRTQRASDYHSGDVPLIDLYPWLIVFLSLLGARLVSSATRRTRKIGFAVWCISNCMIGFGFYQTGNIPQALLFLVGYEYYNIRGYLNNRHQEVS